MKLKNILLSGLSLVLVAALAIGGTIAYLQDSDSDVNVMTLGNVSIEQIEQEWNADETALQDFTQAKPLYPYVGNLGWENTTDNDGAYRRFTMNNVVDKYVSVKNTGKSDAYVRTIIALEMGDFSYDDLGNIIGVSINKYNGSEFQFTGAWDWTDNFEAKIDGKKYNIMVAVHKDAIEPGETTIPSLLQVYMNKDATNEDCEKIDGNGNGTYDVLVFSQAVQVAGFADAETALNAGFGDITTTNHPWADGVNVPVTVSSADDMYAALDAGEKDLVVVGATIDENKFNGRYYKDRNVDFVDCTFTAHMNYMYINDATFTNCTFDCDAANAAVHYDELFGDLVFNNCTFKSGKIQIGANKDMTGTVTFNDCVFENTTSTSIWSDNGIRVYSPATFNGCEFNNRVVLAGSNGLSVTFDSCTMNGGTPVYYVDNTDGIIRGGNIPVVTIK